LNSSNPWSPPSGAASYVPKLSADPSLTPPQEHRHSFVRKNAVFAVYTIYQSHEHLIPDAPELLETFLAAESDATCKRNAFVTLCNIAQPVAVRYLVGVLDGLDAMDELMQMAVIELVRLEAKTEGANRVSRFSHGQSSY
jgi:coatomer subunit beta